MSEQIIPNYAGPRPDVTKDEYARAAITLAALAYEADAIADLPDVLDMIGYMDYGR